MSYVASCTASLTSFATSMPAVSTAPSTGKAGDTESVVVPLTEALVALLKAFFPYTVLVSVLVVALVLIRRASHHDEGVRAGANEVLRVVTGRAFLSAIGQLLGLGSAPPAPMDTTPGGADGAAAGQGTSPGGDGVAPTDAQQ